MPVKQRSEGVCGLYKKRSFHRPGSIGEPSQSLLVFLAFDRDFLTGLVISGLVLPKRGTKERKGNTTFEISVSFPHDKTAV
jgi:hypothetical protein